jgi:hypothetical protein
MLDDGEKSGGCPNRSRGAACPRFHALAFLLGAFLEPPKLAMGCVGFGLGCFAFGARGLRVALGSGPQRATVGARGQAGEDAAHPGSGLLQRGRPGASLGTLDPLHALLALALQLPHALARVGQLAAVAAQRESGLLAGVAAGSCRLALPAAAVAEREGGEPAPGVDAALRLPDRARGRVEVARRPRQRGVRVLDRARIALRQLDPSRRRHRHCHSPRHALLGSSAGS